MSEAPKINYNAMVSRRAGDMGLEQARDEVRNLQNRVAELESALTEMLEANERTGKWSDDIYSSDNWGRVVEQALRALGWGKQDQ